ncbi:MAG: hypothetical protein P1P88_13950, partial [Bacteroidales bacterium]|nr:hypothetical protein [Bacteroidales bacterium]
MDKKKIIKITSIIVIAGLLIGGGIGAYLFFMPHRDVQSASTDYKLTSTAIVEEYLNNKDAANEKYLAADGDSKIFEITGAVKNISENFDGNKVVLIQGEEDKAGVSATFTKETNGSLAGIEVGQTITVKGVIRSGAAYDED